MGFVERFVAARLRQRLFVLLCLAALVLTGVVAYRDLPVEAFPDLTNNQVTVVTEAADGREPVPPGRSVPSDESPGRVLRVVPWPDVAQVRTSAGVGGGKLAATRLNGR